CFLFKCLPSSTTFLFFELSNKSIHVEEWNLRQVFFVKVLTLLSQQDPSHRYIKMAHLISDILQETLQARLKHTYLSKAHGSYVVVVHILQLSVHILQLFIVAYVCL